jgi:hypothetical protein
MSMLVEPDGIWQFFEENLEALQSGARLTVAERMEYGIQILAGFDDYPKLIVEQDEEEVYEECCFNAKDASDTLRRMSDDYLTSKAILDAMDEEEADSVDDEDYADNDLEIEVTEDDIRETTRDFISYVTGLSAMMISDKELEDCTNHFLEYLARKWEHTDIVRPMKLKDADTGESYFTRHPYEDIVWSAPDNPLYKPAE